MINLSLFLALVSSEVKLIWRCKSVIVNPLAFYLIVVTLFPLSLGPESALLQRIAPGVIWVATLLSGLISIDRIFRDDWDDGVIDQMRVAPIALGIPILSKAFSHWLTSGLPALVLAPLVAVLLGMSMNSLGILLITLALGTPVLSLMGTIGVALTIGQKSGGALLAVLVLPFLIPILIFGTTAVDLAATGQTSNAQLSLMGALLIFSLYLAPWASSMALEISSE